MTMYVCCKREYNTWWHDAITSHHMRLILTSNVSCIYILITNTGHIPLLSWTVQLDCLCNCNIVMLVIDSYVICIIRHYPSFILERCWQFHDVVKALVLINPRRDSLEMQKRIVRQWNYVGTKCRYIRMDKNG